MKLTKRQEKYFRRMQEQQSLLRRAKEKIRQPQSREEERRKQHESWDAREDPPKGEFRMEGAHADNLRFRAAALQATLQGMKYWKDKKLNSTQP